MPHIAPEINEISKIRDYDRSVYSDKWRSQTISPVVSETAAKTRSQPKYLQKFQGHHNGDDRVLRSQEDQSWIIKGNSLSDRSYGETKEQTTSNLTTVLHLSNKDTPSPPATEICRQIMSPGGLVVYKESGH